MARVEHDHEPKASEDVNQTGQDPIVEPPNSTVDDWMGQRVGRDGIDEAYTTGRGRVLMRARAEIEERDGGRGERRLDAGSVDGDGHGTLTTTHVRGN